MKVKYKVIFNRRNRKSKDDTYPIEISCYLKENPSSTKRHYHNTGIYISKKQWSKAHLEINKYHANQELLNNRIKQLVTELEEFELKKTQADGGYFQLSYFNDFKNRNKPVNNFIEFIENYIETDNKVSSSTKKQYQNLINRLVDFKGSSTMIKEINLPFVKEFDNFLSAKYRINTVWKQHKNLKKFLNLAIDLDLYPKEMYPYDKFKLKKEQIERVFLTESELVEIENIKIDDKGNFLYWVKATFLFECFTGIRFSDIKTLNRNNFDVSGEKVILKLLSQKTGKFDRIPMNDLFDGKALKILMDVWKEDNTPFFGGYSLQYINRGLKDLENLHKIKKNITTHVGRHTFGAIMSKKVPTPILKKLMQHSDIKTTEVYIHTTNQDVDNSLKDVNW
jgi:integrase